MLLNREFTAEAPNKVWCGDVTYIWAETKWLYLAIVIDLYARIVWAGRALTVLIQTQLARHCGWHLRAEVDLRK